MDTIGCFSPIEDPAEDALGFVFHTRVVEDEKDRTARVTIIAPQLWEEAPRRALLTTRVEALAGHYQRSVLSTWGLGQDEAGTWIAQAAVHAVPLRELFDAVEVAGDTLPTTTLMTIFAKAANAVHGFHTLMAQRQLELTHGALSYDSLALTMSGDVIVIDPIRCALPAAKLRQRSDSAGMLWGHAAPELARGMASDHRADVYSLTAMAYEWATDLFLRDSEDPAELRRLAAGGEFKRPQRIRADFPTRLGDTLVRGLAAEPDQRLVNAEQLAQGLEAWVNETSGPVSNEDLVYLLERYCPDYTDWFKESGGFEEGSRRAPSLPELAIPKPKPKPKKKKAPKEFVDELADVDVDKPSSVSRAITIGTAVVMVVVFGAIFSRMASDGLQSSFFRDFEASETIDDLDLGPVELPAPPPRVAYQFNSEPAGAWIVVNGVPLNAQTPYSTNGSEPVGMVENASNAVTYYLDGYKAHNELVVVGGSAGVLSAELEPLEIPELTEEQRERRAEVAEEAIAAGEEAPIEAPLGYGLIRISTETPGGPLEGATLYVNGRRLEETSPTELFVPARQYTHVYAELEGQRPALAMLRLIPYHVPNDERYVSLELTNDRPDIAQQTSIRFFATPRAAEMTINGDNEGIAGSRLLGSPLHHEFSLSLEGYESWFSALDAVVGQAQYAIVLPEPDTTPGRLSLDISSPGAMIFGERQRLGSTGAAQLGEGSLENHELAPGTWQITLDRRGLGGRERARFDIEIKPGTHHTFSYDFEGDTATLTDSQEETL